MYDFVTIWIDSKDSRRVLGLLKDIKEYIDCQNQRNYFRGKLKNLVVKVNSNGLSINGSIAKYYFGHNLFSLTRGSVKLVFEKISDDIKIDITEGKVYRLEFGDNIILNEPVCEYLQLFGEAKYFKNPYYYRKETIIYQNSKRALEFYDKLKEMKKKRESIPKFYEDKNILRYELKYLKRLKEQFQLNSPVEVKQLYDRKFYLKILTKWRDSYFSIEKQNKLKLLTPNEFYSLNELIEQLAILGIIAIGGIGEINILLENARNKNEINRQQYYRFKKKVKIICQKKKYIERNNCIEELDEKIREATLKQIDLA